MHPEFAGDFRGTYSGGALVPTYGTKPSKQIDEAVLAPFPSDNDVLRAYSGDNFEMIGAMKFVREA